MGRIEIALLLGVLLVAVYADLTTRRIPNPVIAVGAIIGLLLGWTTGGGAELTVRASGFAVGLLVFLPVFALRLVGAGDAKLMAVVGAFVGTSALFPIVFYTLLAGGVLGLIGIIAKHSGQRAIGNLHLVLFALAARTQGSALSPADLELTSAARIPYAVAIAAGVVTWLLTRS